MPSLLSYLLALECHHDLMRVVFERVVRFEVMEEGFVHCLLLDGALALLRLDLTGWDWLVH